MENILRKIIMIFIMFLVFSGFKIEKVNQAPKAEAQDYVIKADNNLNQEDLIDKMLNDIEDEGKVETKIENYEELNLSQKGEYDVKFILEDEEGLKTKISSKLVVTDNKRDYRNEKKKVRKENRLNKKAMKKSEKKQKNASNEAPSATIKNIEVIRGKDLSRKELASQMLVNISDGKDKMDEVDIKIENYNDIKFDKVGEYQVKFMLEDSDGLSTSVSGKVTVINDKKDIKSEESTTKEVTTEEATTQEITTEEATTKEVTTSESSGDNVDASLANNTLINPSACSVSGSRQANVKADIGYGDREYYGYTNSSSQLVYVTAASLEIQDDNSEAVKSSGRYCNDEAKVSGTEQSDLDEGHAIADSLGGVSNAYNITPQESTLNRHGEQYQMEEDLRTALENGHSITDFEYTITYPNNSTQIPSHYDVKYYDNGRLVTHSYDNEYSESSSSIQSNSSYSASEVTTAASILEPTTIEPTTSFNDSSVYYQNCTEVKAAGAAPITPSDAGWQAKFDRDGDGIGCDS